MNTGLNSDMSTPYNMAFACLKCCKSFKRLVNLSEDCPRNMVCPDCGGVAHNFGRHFKSPKKSDAREWNKVRYLFEHGFRFQRVYDEENGHQLISYPKTLNEAKEFVEKHKKYAVT